MIYFMLSSVVEYRHTLFEMINSKWFLPDTHVKVSHLVNKIYVFATGLSQTCQQVVRMLLVSQIVTRLSLTTS